MSGQQPVFTIHGLTFCSQIILQALFHVAIQNYQTALVMLRVGCTSISHAFQNRKKNSYKKQSEWYQMDFIQKSGFSPGLLQFLCSQGKSEVPKFALHEEWTHRHTQTHTECIKGLTSLTLPRTSSWNKKADQKSSMTLTHQRRTRNLQLIHTQHKNKKIFGKKPHSVVLSDSPVILK